MQTVNKTYQAHLEVKKSKFISYLTPYENYENLLNELKSLHPKARHFVTAFRYLNSQNQIIEDSSDDGEPRGSSGRPTLRVMQGHDIINAAIITVRYFGGILLGVGGLVKAYSDAANMVIKKADLMDFSFVFEYDFCVDYDKTREIEYLIKKFNVFVVERGFGIDGIEYKIRDTIEKINLIKEKL